MLETHDRTHSTDPPSWVSSSTASAAAAEKNPQFATSQSQTPSKVATVSPSPTFVRTEVPKSTELGNYKPQESEDEMLSDSSENEQDPSISKTNQSIAHDGQMPLETSNRTSNAPASADHVKLAPANARVGAELMPEEYANTQIYQLTQVVSSFLSEIVTLNDQIPVSSDNLTRFHSRTPPEISIKDYLLRIIRFCAIDRAILVVIIYFIDILSQTYGIFQLNSLTVHRFIITSVTVACKGLCDSFCTNSHYAKVGGIPTVELNLLEVEFLNRVNYRIVPPKGRLCQYFENLLKRERQSPAIDSPRPAGQRKSPTPQPSQQQSKPPSPSKSQSQQQSQPQPQPDRGLSRKEAKKPQSQLIMPSRSRSRSRNRSQSQPQDPQPQQTPPVPQGHVPKTVPAADLRSTPVMVPSPPEQHDAEKRKHGFKAAMRGLASMKFLQQQKKRREVEDATPEPPTSPKRHHA